MLDLCFVLRVWVIAVGVLIEETDIADINVMAKNVTQADIKLVLANLLKGSKNHLAAFSR